jgi:hypothetical protein
LKTCFYILYIAVVLEKGVVIWFLFRTCHAQSFNVQTEDVKVFFKIYCSYNRTEIPSTHHLAPMGHPVWGSIRQLVSEHVIASVSLTPRQPSLPWENLTQGHLMRLSGHGTPSSGRGLRAVVVTHDAPDMDGYNNALWGGDHVPFINVCGGNSS